MNKIKRDFLGDVEIPDGKLYGCCTQRTLNTCSISHHRVPKRSILAILEVKKACAIANCHLQVLPHEKMEAIVGSIDILLSGGFDDQFPVDVFQNGAGTSTNMNVNEVIATLAYERFGVDVHPNDDVNMSQSTNDVIPTAMSISISLAIENELIPALQAMLSLLDSHSEQWKDLIKIGRTHLQDAVPMSLGQEFSAFARQIEKCIERCYRALEILKEVPIGGTAIGTGLTAPKNFSQIAVKNINKQTGMNFLEAKNKFCEQASKDSLVELSGILNSISAAMIKLAKDLKFLSSGPRAGIAELILPATQAGSSIMPGKVNPVMSEMLVQVCYYVNGMMLTVLLGAQNGELQVNTSMSVMTYAVLDSINILANAINNFSRYCLKNLRPNNEILSENAKKSLMLITNLAPLIGHEIAAEIVNVALERNISIIEVLRERKILDGEDIQDLCDPRSMC